ncbi:hypothetical protein B0O80DRAFT_187302 [Mortierella sp. GBAus27b]|nr:hypothetical protein B0O80DRAFT_187302 [Mortierella sp. GBAus27b]
MFASHPLELPEILQGVASCVPRRSLPACVRVCRTWHRVFLPFIWRDVKLGLDRSCSPTALKNHCHLVKTLQAPFGFPQKYASLACPSLESLQVLLEGHDCYLIEFILHHHATLIRLELERLGPDLQSVLWDMLVGFDNLKDLTLLNTSIREKEMDSFWQFCANLQRLDFRELSFAVAQSQLSLMTFPRVREIYLSEISGDQVTTILSFLQRCPAMATFSWATNNDETDSRFVSGFAPLVSKRTWPGLGRVALKSQVISNENITRVIEGMHRISTLTFGHIKMAFGPNSMDQLRPHLPHLRELHMKYDVGLTSCMAQEIMSSCPLLEILEVPWIQATDVVAGKPWVCTRLRRLRVCFRFSPSTFNLLQRSVFDQLAKLVRIEELIVDGRQDETTRLYPAFQESLDLRLDQGLATLSTLGSLRYISFSCTKQRMEKQEIEWILDHWKRLVKMNGIMNKWSSIVDSSLRSRLSDRRIRLGAKPSPMEYLGR